MDKKPRINWTHEKTLLLWLISDTIKHRKFLKKELKGTDGAINHFYNSKKLIIEGKESPYLKDKQAKSYDRYMKKFKVKQIKPNII